MDAVARQLAAPERGFARRRTILVWSSVGMAASLLLVCAIGSFYFFRGNAQNLQPDVVVALSDDRHSRRAVEQEPAKPPAASTQNAADSTMKRLAETAPTPLPARGAAAKSSTVPAASQAAEARPAAPKNNALGSGDIAKDKLEIIPAGPLLALPLHELDRQEKRDHLRNELSKQKAFHLELRCRGNGKVLERLQVAFEAQGVNLLVDAEARLRLGARRSEADYVVYAQEMTAAELAGALERLAMDDAHTQSWRHEPSQFDSFSVLSLSAGDRRELIGMLGVDPLLMPIRSRAPVDADIQKPLSQGGAKGSADPQAGQPSGKSLSTVPTRSALLIPNGIRPKPLSSVEIHQFLNNRKPRRPEAIQVFLILRGA
jgi:hypothetical protein